MLGLVSFILNLSVLNFIILLTLAFIAFLSIRYYLEQIPIGNLSKKAVYITGCDSGFGRGLALKCLEQGMPVFAACLTEQGMASLHKDSKGFKGTLQTFVLNVTDDKSCEDVAKKIEESVEKYGGLHAVVNNAGVTGRSLPDEFQSLKDHYDVANINLWGAIRTTKSVTKLIKRAKGRIVTVASICARVGLPGLAPYTVTKYGISGYCDVLRQELRPFGISVHILEPGFFDTPLLARNKVEKDAQEAWENAPAEVKEEYGLEYLETNKANMTKFLNMIASREISLVVDAYFHAITAKFPRSRYQCGWDSILLFIPFSYLPTGLQDIVYASVLYFGPRPAKA